MLVYVRGDERVLTLMGAGVSDQQDVLLDTAHGATCMASMWAFLAQHRYAFDVCELENLAGGSPLLRHPPGSDWRVESPVQRDVRPVLRLDASAPEVDRSIPAGMGARVRYLRRRAARDGLPLQVTQADGSTVERLFASLVDLHRARWAARGQSGMLSDRLVAFHHEVVVRMLAQGLLRLYVLHLGGHPAAALYGFHSGRRTVYYLGGFEPALERYSPGLLVVAHAIERARADDGALEFDFLRGAEPYKYAWGAVDEPLYRYALRVRAPKHDLVVGV
jgi:CelD/BcsL family acetyltransferase involved in cellulose biosynthesis